MAVERIKCGSGVLVTERKHRCQFPPDSVLINKDFWELQDTLFKCDCGLLYVPTRESDQREQSSWIQWNKK